MLGTVMLIDDDSFCNRMNRFILEKYNAAREIITHTCALDAFRQLNSLVERQTPERFPDTIFLDLNMPQMDGWEFLKRYSSFPQAFRKKTSLYVLTSSLQTCDRVRALIDPNVTGFIEKPFTELALEHIMVQQNPQALVCYKSSCLTIYYQPDKKMARSQWYGFATSVDYRKGLLAYLDVMKRYDVRLWLGDYKQARVIRQKDQVWTKQEWYPQLISVAQKIKKFARIQSTDIFHRIGIENMLAMTPAQPLPFTVKEFSGIDEAQAWLLQQESDYKMIST